jgi:hypothetical protein
MKAWRSQYPITVMDKVFKVSRSGLPLWMTGRLMLSVLEGLTQQQ